MTDQPADRPDDTAPPESGGDGDPPRPAGKRKAPPRKPFLLRLPPELMDELKGWASHELRSLNGHIEYLLRDAVKRRRGKGQAEEDSP